MRQLEPDQKKFHWNDTSAKRSLPAFLDESVEGESTIRVSRCADGDTGRDPVLPLNRLSLRGGHVGGESDEQVPGDSLLDRQIRARRAGLGAAGDHWADR